MEDTVYSYICRYDMDRYIWKIRKYTHIVYTSTCASCRPHNISAVVPYSSCRRISISRRYAWRFSKRIWYSLHRVATRSLASIALSNSSSVFCSLVVRSPTWFSRTRTPSFRSKIVGIPERRVVGHDIVEMENWRVRYSPR